MFNEEQERLNKLYCIGCNLYKYKLGITLVCYIREHNFHKECPCLNCLVKVICRNHYSGCPERETFVKKRAKGK